MTTDRQVWLCGGCREVLATIEDGEPDPQMPPVQQVTALADKWVFVCQCGHVQVWHRVAVDKHLQIR